jgi:hypothetical protein
MAKKKHKKDPDSWAIKRNRNGDEHINGCTTGYRTSSVFTQIHHIVCVSSMSDGTISDYVDSDQLELIRKCLAKTNWNINAGPNTVGLPLKRAFVDKLAPQNWGGWPCHQVDHNPHYTKGVSKRLNDQVWQNCLENAQNCDDGVKIIETQLTNESKYWLGRLSGRATVAAWNTRHQHPDTWYIPFSMHPGIPTPRKPPPDWDNQFSANMQGLLKGLFAAL